MGSQIETGVGPGTVTAGSRCHQRTYIGRRWPVRSDKTGGSQLSYHAAAHPYQAPRATAAYRRVAVIAMTAVCRFVDEPGSA